MKRVCKSSRLWISFALLVLSLVFLSSQSAYGWLANVIFSSDRASFDTATLSDPLLIMWRYNTEEEAEPYDDVTAGWQALCSGSAADDRFSVTHADAGIAYADDEEQPHLSVSLHFGTVDNLTELDADNYIFIRIKAEKPDGLAASTSLWVAATMTGVTVYDKEGVDLADPSQSAEERAIPAQLLTNNNINPYLLFSWFSSATAYTAADLFEDHLGDFTPFEAPTVDPVTGETAYELVTDPGAASAAAEYYYLCITPDLSYGDNAFAQAAEDLTTSMPATIYFEMTFEFEIRQAASEW